MLSGQYLSVIKTLFLLHRFNICVVLALHSLQCYFFLVYCGYKLHEEQRLFKWYVTFCSLTPWVAWLLKPIVISFFDQIELNQIEYQHVPLNEISNFYVWKEVINVSFRAIDNNRIYEALVKLVILQDNIQELPEIEYSDIKMLL